MTPQYNHKLISIFKGSAVDGFRHNGVVCSYFLDKNSRGLYFILKKNFALAKHLLKNKYDIIHFHGGGISVLLLAVIFRRNSKVIFHLHAGNVTGIPFKSWIPAIHKLIYRSIDKHVEKIATCEHVKKFYVEEIKPAKTEPIHLIRNFTPYNFTAKKRKNFCTGYIGRIANEKGVQLFFELCKSVELHKLNLKFAIMGDIANELDLIIKEKVSNGGMEYYSPSLKVEKFYEMIDILIFPSELTETLPLVILEAVSFDVAVIAKSSKATEEIFSSYPMLIERVEENLFIQKIKEYYSSQFIAEDLRRQHESTAAKFGKMEYCSSITSLYESLLRI